MANPKTVDRKELRPGTPILVRGKVAFSRIRSHVSGQELEERNRRDAQRGMKPKNVPYTQISVYGAEIIPGNPTAGLTKEEIFVQECFYQSASQASPGVSYGITNTSPYLPRVAVMESTVANEIPQGEIQGELDHGLDVTLVLGVFFSKKNKINSIGLNMILCNEPIRYYAAGNNVNLAQYGITVNAAPAPQEPAFPMQDDDAAAPASPMGQPAGQPYSTQPPYGPPPAQEAYYPQPAPAPYSYQQQPAPQPYAYTPGMDQNPFGAPAPAPASAPAPAPYDAQGPGVAYDPNKPERAY